ncbi:metal-dependent transcriptional regulator [Methanohalophilus sp.]|uniref:metal-dependent transcriptional regulator n=1 Tax=Methanohalophilus sp. TaxID=1966352 RepID=UPI00261CDD01|nr:metal-dependent transcriptional regulator [Methanohalophilus sp.]MDK2892995.1 DtxR family transcriptional regulator, Mn-dependent transcriptional regulator [Methanohalophilus sp.]
MASGKTEEYLETILSLICKNYYPVKNKDIADEMDIAPATVTEMIKRLSDEGFVKYIPYRGVELTDKGIKKARELQHKHNILRDFLSQVLHIDDVAADREACVLEHSASDIVLESMVAYMEEKGIVRKHISDVSNTCRSTEGDYIRLSDLHEGEKAIVALIHLPKSDRDRLTSLGIITGEDVEIKRRQKQGCISILVKGTEIALGKVIANKIFVMRKCLHNAGGEVD